MRSSVGQSNFFLIGKDGKTTRLEKIPEGAVRVHLYNFSNILRPRGTLQKESLSLNIYEKLTSSFKEWTDKDHGDSRLPEEVIEKLKQNLKEEVDNAFDKFLNEFTRQNLEETK